MEVKYLSAVLQGVVKNIKAFYLGNTYKERNNKKNKVRFIKKNETGAQILKNGKENDSEH